jgi:site-specific DNA-methyltransferase (adenine-specific)
VIDLRLGDCLEHMCNMGNGSVDVVITDPPYGLNFPYLSYDDTRENLKSLINDFMPEVLRVAKRAVFILCGPTQISLYPQADWCGAVTWNTTGSFGKYGYSQWTPVLCYGTDLKGFGNVNGVTKTDTIKISGGGGVGFTRGDLEKEHTCPKPITMMDAIVTRYAGQNETILDIFMGSGTTGVACVRLGRNFIGIEKEPKYFEIAEKRIASAQQQMVMPL